MYSDGDTPKGWVAPFGHPGIKACSQLPRAFRSVPRPSSPPGAKASTRCPSHAQTLSRHPAGRQPNPPCTGTIHAPNSRDATHPQSHNRPIRIIYSAHTFTPLNTAAAPALSHPAIPSRRQRHALGQTPMPAQPRTPRHSPQPSMRQAHARPRPPEMSCASRDAPEPDSQSAKNKPTPSRGTQATPPTPALCRGQQWQARSYKAAQPNHDQPIFSVTTMPTHRLVEADGIEPTTPCLQSRCSPS